jgi:hypothetical protein
LLLVVEGESSSYRSLEAWVTCSSRKVGRPLEIPRRVRQLSQRDLGASAGAVEPGQDGELGRARRRAAERPIQERNVRGEGAAHCEHRLQRDERDERVPPARRIDALAVQAARDDREQVFLLHRQPVQERGAARTAHAVAKGEPCADVVRRVPSLRGGRVGFGQLARGVLLDARVEAEANGIAVAPCPEQRLVTQGLEHVERRRRPGEGSEIEHGGGRLEGEAASEDGALGERALLRRVEQIPRPVDRPAQRSLARADIAWAQAAAEAFVELGRREDADARRGELDREG